MRQYMARLSSGAAADLDDGTNMIFIGNPGTGKTTCAELMSALMAELGFRDGTYFKFTGSQLINMTAKTFSEDSPTGPCILTRVRKGLLFVDECYQLNPKGPGGTEGQKILDAIMDHLSVYERTSTVIFAGYESQVRDTIAANVGLPRRFQYTFNFEDFSEIELRKIYRDKVTKRGFRLPTKTLCGMNVARVIAARLARGRGHPGFGNAGLVGNKVGAAVQSFMLRKALERARAVKTGGSVDLSHFMTLSKEDVLGKKPVLERSPILDDMERFVGLAGVKAKMRALMTTVLENWEREERGEPVAGLPLHTVFLGPPGTGKTEMAKVYGRLLKEWGFLSKGEFIYKKASDFVTNGVVGDATQRATKIIESAAGSVLMIDEAYGLNPKRDASGGSGGSMALTGAETVDAIMQAMPIGENSDCVVILAGYKEDMDAFFNNPTTNQGMASRFNYSSPWVFESFTDGELKTLFRNKCNAEGVACSPAVRDAFIQHLGRQRKVPGYANARTLETAVAAGRAALQQRQHAARAAGQPVPTHLEILDLVPDAPNPDVAHLLFEGKVTVPAVAQYVKEVIAAAKVATAEGRDPSDTLGDLHVCLMGPAGVGKSVTARMIAELFYRLGALPRNNLVEVLATNLEGRFVGQTQDVVQALFKSAAGGVLFIDEADRLGSESTFMREAVAQILGLVEGEYKGRLLIVTAGYEGPVRAALASNQGLGRRLMRRAVVIEKWSVDMCVENFSARAGEAGLVSADGPPPGEGRVGGGRAPWRRLCVPALPRCGRGPPLQAAARWRCG